MAARGRRPCFGRDEACALVVAHWGFSGELLALPSYDDLNWLVRRCDGGAPVVLKVAAAFAECRGLCDEAMTAAALRCEHAMMARLAGAGVGVPRVVPTVAGEALRRVVDACGSVCFCRLVTFESGRSLASCRGLSSDALLSALGKALGSADAALAGFDDGGVATRELAWDLGRASEARRYLCDVADASRRDLTERALTRFEALAQTEEFGLLPRQVLHGDANDENVLVEEEDDHDAWRVTLLDFGDFVRGPRVFELAIALAYALFDAKDHARGSDESSGDGGAREALRKACVVAAAYHATNPLSPNELEALWPCVAARNCQTVLHSAHASSLEPDDAYLTTSAAPAWRLLAQVDALPANDAALALKKACHLA